MGVYAIRHARSAQSTNVCLHIAMLMHYQGAQKQTTYEIVYRGGRDTAPKKL